MIEVAKNGMHYSVTRNALLKKMQKQLGEKKRLNHARKV